MLRARILLPIWARPCTVPVARPLTMCYRDSSSSARVEDEASSRRRQFKNLPIDPKLFQHLERQGLGWVSRKNMRFPRGSLVTKEPDPSTIPYFQQNKFRHAKRAMRKERKKIERQTINLIRAGLLRPEKKVPRDIDDRETREEREADALDKQRNPFAVRARTRLARVVDVASLPPPIPGVPEMAIIGRSNVGKSTLLNSVLNIRGARKAAVADRPGVTQSLDFYMLGPRDRPLMMVVDMPGYGFAFADEGKKDRWQALMMHFLRYPRPSLKRILLLLDARHGIKMSDKQFLEALYSPAVPEDEDEDNYGKILIVAKQEGQQNEGDAAAEEEEEEGEKEPEIAKWQEVAPLPPKMLPKLQIVLTKCDLVTREDLARRVYQIRTQMHELLPRETTLPVVMVSADKGLGVEELREDLGALVPPKLMRQMQERAEALARERDVAAGKADDKRDERKEEEREEREEGSEGVAEVPGEVVLNRRQRRALKFGRPLEIKGAGGGSGTDGSDTDSSEDEEGSKGDGRERRFAGGGRGRGGGRAFDRSPGARGEGRFGGERREGRFGGERREGRFGGDRREGRFGGDRREGRFGGEERGRGRGGQGWGGRGGGRERESGEDRFSRSPSGREDGMGERREGRFGGDRGERRSGGDRREERFGGDRGEGRFGGDRREGRFGGDRGGRFGGEERGRGRERESFGGSPFSRSPDAREEGPGGMEQRFGKAIKEGRFGGEGEKKNMLEERWDEIFGGSGRGAVFGGEGRGRGGGGQAWGGREGGRERERDGGRSFSRSPEDRRGERREVRGSSEEREGRFGGDRREERFGGDRGGRFGGERREFGGDRREGRFGGEGRGGGRGEGWGGRGGRDESRGRDRPFSRSPDGERRGGGGSRWGSRGEGRGGGSRGGGRGGRGGEWGGRR